MIVSGFSSSALWTHQAHTSNVHKKKETKYPCVSKFVSLTKTPQESLHILGLNTLSVKNSWFEK